MSPGDHHVLPGYHLYQARACEVLHATAGAAGHNSIGMPIHYLVGMAARGGDDRGGGGGGGKVDGRGGGGGGGECWQVFVAAARARR